MKKKLRLFIAINLSETLKNKIERELEKIRYSFTDDIRFIDRKQWHITIAFLGYQNPEAAPSIVKSMETAAENFPLPEIEFTDISYGPKGMIWLLGAEKTSASLAALKEKLEDALIDNGVVFKKEHRRFQVHITLARLRAANSDLPEIAIPVQSGFDAGSLDLMESHPSRTGDELLQSIKFSL